MKLDFFLALISFIFTAILSSCGGSSPALEKINKRTTTDDISNLSECTNERVAQGYSLISSPSDLAQMVDQPERNYVLSQNIDLSGLEFEPLRFGDEGFMGTLDGCDFEISNWRHREAAVNSSLALIDVNFGTIKNLKLKGFSLQADTVASLAIRSGGIMENIDLDQMVLSGFSHASGAVSLLDGRMNNVHLRRSVMSAGLSASGIGQFCTNEVDGREAEAPFLENISVENVILVASASSGICDRFSGWAKRLRFSGEIRLSLYSGVSSRSAGGIMGYANNFRLSEVMSEGVMTFEGGGPSLIGAGGLVGVAEFGWVIEDSVSRLNIHPHWQIFSVGGIVGESRSSFADFRGKLERVLSLGHVSGTGRFDDPVGAILGRFVNFGIPDVGEGVIFDFERVGQTSLNLFGPVPRSTTQIQSLDTYGENFDRVNVWDIEEGRDPSLRF